MGTFTDRLSRVGWLPARTRAKLSRSIRARNALDRQLAEQHGLPTDDPRCARFQGVAAHETLDREVRVRRARAGA